MAHDDWESVPLDTLEFMLEFCEQNPGKNSGIVDFIDSMAECHAVKGLTPRQEEAVGNIYRVTVAQKARRERKASQPRRPRAAELAAYRAANPVTTSDEWLAQRTISRRPN
jgi:hypothetical protein